MLEKQGYNGAELIKVLIFEKKITIIYKNI